MAAAVDGIVAKYPTEDVVLVVRRMVGRALASHLLTQSDLCIPRLELNTDCISLFERTEEGWTALLLNDTCHLQAGPAS